MFKCLLGVLVVGIGVLLLWDNQYHPRYHKSTHQCGLTHISVDDTLTVFQDLTKNNYSSIFEHNTFALMKDLHDKYGMTVSFYCYYSIDVNGGFNLSDVTDKYTQEFSDNASWMKFGFHAADSQAYQNLEADFELEYYKKTMAELERITGTSECLEYVLRLDRYVANANVVETLRANGVKGLLIADRETPDRESYDLSLKERTSCYANDLYTRNDNFIYSPTDIRLENIENDQKFYDLIDEICGEPYVVVFTHEVYLEDQKVQKYLEWSAEHTLSCNGHFGFVEGK